MLHLSLLGVLSAVDLAEHLGFELVVEDLMVDESGIWTTSILVDRISDIFRLE